MTAAAKKGIYADTEKLGGGGGSFVELDLASGASRPSGTTGPSARLRAGIDVWLAAFIIIAIQFKQYKIVNSDDILFLTFKGSIRVKKSLLQIQNSQYFRNRYHFHRCPVSNA
jgi:hypothetical protein